MTVKACRGFVYATAVMGVTGARTTTSDLAGPLVERTKAAVSSCTATCRWPSGSASAPATRPPRWPPFADGVIVGSAFVRTLLDHADDARRQV